MPPAKNDDAQTARYEEILASLQAKGVLAASKVSGTRVTGKKPEKRPAAADPNDHEKPAADGTATPSTTAGENSAEASSSTAPPAKKKAKAKATPKPKTKAKAAAKPAAAKPAAPAREDGDANHEPRVAYSDKFWDDELKMMISWKVFPEVVKRCSKIYVADAPAIRDALIPKLRPPPEDLLEKLRQAEAAEAESEAAAAPEAATPGPTAKSTKAEAKPKAKGKAKATPKAKQPAKPPSPEPCHDEEGDDEGDEEGEEEQMEDDAETMIAN